MNLMSLSVIVASLILPVTKTENIKTDFTGKLLRMGYSQEESLLSIRKNPKSSATQTIFAHQNNAGEIDWGQLSFSLSKSYVNYSLKLLSNNPGFEQGLSNYLIIGVN